LHSWATRPSTDAVLQRIAKVLQETIGLARTKENVISEPIKQAR
jgi:hypothetical protein